MYILNPFPFIHFWPEPLQSRFFSEPVRPQGLLVLFYFFGGGNKTNQTYGNDWRSCSLCFVCEVWEHGAAPATPAHRQLLSDPSSQPEVSHRRCHLHGRAAEEAGHGRYSEEEREISHTVLQYWLFIAQIHMFLNVDVLNIFLCVCVCVFRFFSHS